MSEVTITVSGRVGSGKSAICGEIEILCKALGLQVEWIDGQQEKNLTHADWTEALEMYKPSVKIVELLAAQPSQAQAAEAVIRAGEDMTVTNVPTRIYLNLGDIYEMGEIPFQSLTDVTWCEDRIDDTDIEYVRADTTPPASPVASEREGLTDSQIDAIADTYAKRWSSSGAWNVRRCVQNALIDARALATRTGSDK